MSNILIICIISLINILILLLIIYTNIHIKQLLVIYAYSALLIFMLDVLYIIIITIIPKYIYICECVCVYTCILQFLILVNSLTTIRTIRLYIHKIIAIPCIHTLKT